MGLTHCGDLVTTEDYRKSLYDTDNENMFSLGYQWRDKPHRHVFDLCRHIEEQDEVLEHAYTLLTLLLADYQYLSAEKVRINKVLDEIEEVT